MPLVTAVIPTYNRRRELQATLRSLARQTLPRDQYEVIVVDDGSPGAQAVDVDDYPMRVCYLRRPKEGATRARNSGAQTSTGQVIVFIDDDVTGCPETLASLVQLCLAAPRTIVLGTLITPDRLRRSAFARIHAPMSGQSIASPDAAEVAFAECKTGLLAIRRSDFFELGLFEDPGGGWPNWDDVDFGYRAHLRGFTLRQSPTAIGYHWDYSLTDVDTAGLRWQRASRAAVWLFKKHPGLQPSIPMFADKTPPAWRHDPPWLLARKLARAAAATQPVRWGLQRAVDLLEQRFPAPGLLRPLYRWIIGTYIFDGYQQGLKDYP